MCVISNNGFVFKTNELLDQNKGYKLTKTVSENSVCYNLSIVASVKCKCSLCPKLGTSSVTWHCSGLGLDSLV
jgi:hypothetical protein